MDPVIPAAIEGAKVAFAVAVDYAMKHPKSTALTATSVALIPALGSGWLIALPLKTLGFGPLGPTAGSAAAWLQATLYGACVPTGSIFSIAQYLGMTLGF